MTCQIFLSHSSADKVWVDWIAGQASRLGVLPYLAEHDPQPGTLLSTKVREAIRDSDAVIVLFTKTSIESPYVNQEIGVAIEQDKLIVPLVHPQVEARSRAMLDGLEYILFDFDSPAEGSTSLLTKIEDLAGRTATMERRQTAALVAVAAIVVLLLIASSDG
jgi:hypothetical protein